MQIKSFFQKKKKKGKQENESFLSFIFSFLFFSAQRRIKQK